MWSTDEIIRALRARGELWETVSGLVTLRGGAGALCRALEGAIGSMLLEEADDEWRVPPAISLEALERADYFASFPQWLTVAAHLGANPATLERVASTGARALASDGAIAPPGAALLPAVCYHIYAALADSALARARCITVQGSCWRHEGERTIPLERGWAFTMREAVCLGSAAEVQRFVDRGARRATCLARELGLQPSIAQASDPFFAPAGRGKALLQRLKELKRELTLPLGSGCAIAAASFNDHQTFFGDAFGIRNVDGAPVSTGCIAFGIERWALAWMSAHGPDPSEWPPIRGAPPFIARE